MNDVTTELLQGRADERLDEVVARLDGYLAADPDLSFHVAAFHDGVAQRLFLADQRWNRAKPEQVVGEAHAQAYTDTPKSLSAVFRLVFLSVLSLR